MIKIVVSSISFALLTFAANASDPVPVNATKTAALLDGRCGGDEWDTATIIELPAHLSLFLMHDKHSVYFCAKSAIDDPMALDLYIEHPQTGHRHQFHLSAQMGERIYTDADEGEPNTWELKDWAGFWTPYYGLEEDENGERVNFYRKSNKQVQILRKKFPSDTWNMMAAVGVRHLGERSTIFYPPQAEENDTMSWGTFSFSEE